MNRRNLTAGGIKRWLEDISVEMGLDGEITEAVKKEGEKRLKKLRVKKDKRASVNNQRIARELVGLARELIGRPIPKGWNDMPGDIQTALLEANQFVNAEMVKKVGPRKYEIHLKKMPSRKEEGVLEGSRHFRSLRNYRGDFVITMQD